MQSLKTSTLLRGVIMDMGHRQKCSSDLKKWLSSAQKGEPVTSGTERRESPVRKDSETFKEKGALEAAH